MWRSARTQLSCVLTVRGRRVLENACAKKRRLNPAGSQRRNFRKLNGRKRHADQWRMSSMIVAARCDHCRCAIVLDATCILVDALMQLRGSTERERPKKPYGDEGRDDRTSAIIRPRQCTHSAASLSPARLSCKQFPARLPQLNQTRSELTACSPSVVAGFSARFSTHLKSDAMISAGRIPGC